MSFVSLMTIYLSRFFFFLRDLAQQAAKRRYDAVLKTCGGKELLVSGSDDFTMYLWDPFSTKKPITRMTGHQQVCFWSNLAFVFADQVFPLGNM